MEKKKTRLDELRIPVPPPVMVSREVKYADLSWPLKLAVIMGLIQFVCLVVYLVFVFLAGLIWVSMVM